MSLIKKSLLAAAAVTAFAVPGAQAAVGDTLTYQFNSEATGSFVAGTSQATLILTESLTGVDFELVPNWGVTTGNFVQQLQFGYSGVAVTYADGAGPNAAFSAHSGSFDSSYSFPGYIELKWTGPGTEDFKPNDTTKWSLNGAGVDLVDFSQVSPSSSDQKPGPIFGVISMPGAVPSNWVAGEGELVTNPVPEPGTYALMAAGLALVAFTARRRQRQQA